MRQKYADRGLEVVALTDEPPSDLLADPVLARTPVTLLPNARPVFQQYGVEGIPHTFYFEPGGRVFEMEGYDPKLLDEVDQRLERLPRQ